MSAQIETSKAILRRFADREAAGLAPSVDRDEVVSHATLSGLAHHWPSRVSESILELLNQCSRIPQEERSRWVVQRRIAISKLARHFS
jgi:hypothetical protein